MALKRSRATNLLEPWGGCFDSDDYPRGSIKRLRLENFMTYKEAIIYPGPRLNLVLGPNGSGKSSVVVAIGVALCAHVKHLGRSTDIKEMIRKGEDKASVELMFSGGMGRPDVRIERIIQVGETGTRSTFKVNGATRPQREMEELCKDLNIQLDNLCQFLPQEKVVEFSKMGPTELLASTERAIGNGELLRKHERLISGGNDLKARTDRQANAARQLERKKEESEALQRDVDKIREHDSLKQRAALLFARVTQLEEQEAKALLEQKRADHKAMEEKVEALRLRDEARRAPVRAMEATMEGLRKQEQSAERAARAVASAVDQWANVDVEAAEEEVGAARAELQALERTEAARQSSLRDHREQLTAAMDELDAFPDLPPEYDAAREKELKARRQALAAQLATVSGQKAEDEQRQVDTSEQRRRALHKIEQLRAVRRKRLEACDNLGAFRGRLVNFKERVETLAGQGAFAGTVCGPIGAEMSMRRNAPAHAADALENCIAGKFFHTFVTERPEDAQMLRRVAASECQIDNLNTMVYQGAVHTPMAHPRAPPGGFDPSLGVLCPLDAVFDAPMLVKKVLAESSGIHVTYLVADDSCAEAAFAHTGISLLFSPTSRHQKTVSRYSAAGVSFSQGALRPSRLMHLAVDEAAVRALQEEVQQIDAASAELEVTLAEARAREADVQRERSAAEAELKHFSDLRAAHTKKRGRLELIIQKLRHSIDRQDKAAPLLKKPALEKRIKVVSEQQTKRLQELVSKRLPQQLELLQEIAHMKIKRAATTAEIAALEAERVAAQQERAELVRDEQVARREVHDAARRHELISQEWRQAQTGLEADALGELDALPQDRDECANEGEELNQRAEALTLGDRGLVERHERLLADIKRMTDESAACAREVAQLEADLEEAKATWLPELRTKVASISSLFSQNFKRIGSVGEVRLHEAGEEYSGYAIEIRIKFRAEDELATLDPSRHSGGEKSVSTIMYLLSLQKITSTPFRIVDEINQGMDQTNERKVFQAMVDAATERHTAQCLLMTPKLLPQLTFSEHVNVLNIMNGVHIAPAANALVPSDPLKLVLGDRWAEDEE